jgi:hypothetical protein
MDVTALAPFIFQDQNVIFYFKDDYFNLKAVNGSLFLTKSRHFYFFQSESSREAHEGAQAHTPPVHAANNKERRNCASQ